MRPTQADVLDSISFTIDEYLAPEVTSEIAQSLVLTIRYLLHQTRARVEHEAQALYDQALDLRRTLSEVVGFLERTRRDGTDADAVAETVIRQLEQTRRPDGAYPTLTSLQDETTALRRELDRVIVELDRRRGSVDGDAADATRALVRQCLRRQLEAEERWMMSGYSAPRR